MPTKQSGAFAALAMLRPGARPATRSKTPKPAVKTGNAPTAASALALNRTSAPLRAERQNDYQKIGLRNTSKNDRKRIQEILSFLNRHGRSTVRTAAFRAALRAAPIDETFLAAYDKQKDDVRDGPAISINVLPSDNERLQAFNAFLIGNERTTNAGDIARTAIHVIDLDDNFLRSYDDLAGQDGRRLRFTSRP